MLLLFVLWECFPISRWRLPKSSRNVALKSLVHWRKSDYLQALFDNGRTMTFSEHKRKLAGTWPGSPLGSIFWKIRPDFLTIAIKKGTVTSTAFKVRLVKTVLWALCSNSLSSESSFFLSICLFGHLVHGVSSRIAVWAKPQLISSATSPIVM